jgi:hypothetical protein
LGEIALRHGAYGAGHFRRRPHQVVDERVERNDLVSPSADGAGYVHALFEFSFLPDHPTHAGDLGRAPRADPEDVVEDVSDFSIQTREVASETHREVAVLESGESCEEIVRKRADREGIAAL